MLAVCGEFGEEEGFVESGEVLHFGGGGDGAGSGVHFVAEFVVEDFDGGCGVFHGDDGEGEFGEEGEEGFFSAGFCGAELPDFLCPVDRVDAVDGGFCEGGEVVGVAGESCVAEDLVECCIFVFGEVDVEVFFHDVSSYFGCVEVTGQWSFPVFLRVEWPGNFFSFFGQSIPLYTINNR